MSKYKCAQALCNYISDSVGECCGQPLVETSEKSKKLTESQKKAELCSCKK